ncbi:MAG: DUF2325 domain-containing protein [Magnetovibrio sp.]|nr:DUF2325 domain-containing protein [Magnetovibrio sp.]
MCKNCDKNCGEFVESRSQIKGRFALSRTKPKKIADLKPGWMCSLVGTCFTLEELQKLTRRLKLEFGKANITDYELHGYFVGAASSNPNVSRAMHSMLVRKYRQIWNKFAQISTVDELETLWDTSMSEGDVAGPYWAVLSHPLATLQLQEKAYGEVHMLSHLVGATNRSSLKALRKNEIEVDRMREELDQARCDIWSRDRIIAGLRNELDSEKRIRQIDTLDRIASRDDMNTNMETISESLRVALDDADQTNQKLQDALARKAKRIEGLEIERERLKQDLKLLEAESNLLENVSPSFLGQTCVNDGQTCHGEDECPYDLCHKRVLYVGGRAKMVSRYRDVVEGWNGEFLHHDGGVEQSYERLGGLLDQADVVVFPADCVSHSAVDHIKTQCRQSGKRMMPVRTAGLGAFMTGLQDLAKQGRLAN